MIKKFKINDIFLGQKFNYKRKITIDLVKKFSLITGDYHPLHNDYEYSIKSGFEGIIAQGFLLTSFMSFIVGMELPGENALILSQESKFIKPVYIENEISIECEITNIDLRFSTFILTYNAFNQNRQRVISGNVKVKIRNPIIKDN